MKTIDEMIEDILKHEGGYVDHPNDKGGATNFGVSLRYARDIGLDNDGDGDTDKDDIRLVTRKQAAKLYKDDFLIKPRISSLPVEYQPQLFDMAVNHGAHRAVTLFQHVLNDLMGPNLDTDGIVGKKTRQTAEYSVERWGWQHVNNALVDKRIAFFRAIVKNNPKQKVFLKGWLARAESFRVEE